MIKSFKDKRLERVEAGLAPKGFPSHLVRRTRALLNLLDAAVVLDDLRSPPGNRLEALSGDRAGQHAVRVNAQFRLCFVWADGGPDEVELIDYH